MRSLALAFALTFALATAGCAFLARNPSTSSTTTPPPTGTTSSSTSSSTTTTTTTTTPVTPSDYALNVTGVPASVNASESFFLTLFVNGTRPLAGVELDARFGSNSSSGGAPSLALYPQTCEQQTTNVPGNVTMRCAVADSGIVYLRGHARVNDSGGNPVDLWSDEQRVLVVGNYTVQTDLQSGTGNVNAAHLNTAFSFKVFVNSTGAGTVSATVDARYNQTPQSPEQAGSPASTATYPSACTSLSALIPGQVTISCTFTDPTAGPAAYLRAHVRVTDAAGANYDFWSPEYAIVIAPV